MSKLKLDYYYGSLSEAYELKRKKRCRLIDAIIELEGDDRDKRGIMFDDDLKVDIVDGRVVFPEFNPELPVVSYNGDIFLYNVHFDITGHRYTLIKNILIQHKKLHPDFKVSIEYGGNVYDKESHDILISCGSNIGYEELSEETNIEVFKNIDDYEFLSRYKDIINSILDKRTGYRRTEVSYSFYCLFKDRFNPKYDISHNNYINLDLYLRDNEIINKNYIAELFGYYCMYHTNKEITDLYSPKFGKKITLGSISNPLLIRKCILHTDYFDGKQLKLQELHMFYMLCVPHHIIDRNHVLINAYKLCKLCTESGFIDYISPLINNKIKIAHLSKCSNNNCFIRTLPTNVKRAA